MTQPARMMIYWLIVLLPLAAGVEQTAVKAAALFESSVPPK